MDSEKFSFRKKEKGAALITMVLMILLVTALLMMALNISGIESNLASTNRRTTQGFQAAEAAIQIANQVIQDTLELNALPTNPPNPSTTRAYPATIVFDCSNSPTIGDANLHDFVEELRNGGGLLANDSATGDTTYNCAAPPIATTADPGAGKTRGPDLTVTALGHTMQIDIDLEGTVNLPGSELEEFAVSYHKKVSGAGCGAGTLYYIDVVSVGPLNTRSNVGSAYYKC